MQKSVRCCVSQRAPTRQQLDRARQEAEAAANALYLAKEQAPELANIAVARLEPLPRTPTDLPADRDQQYEPVRSETQIKF